MATMSAVAAATVLLAVAAVGIFGAETYPAAWDNFDLNKILSNDRLVNTYINCFLEKGPCSPEGKVLKRTLPELVKTQCAKCSEKQKQLGLKVIKFMIEKKPQHWQQITNKYDPSGEFMKNVKTRL